MPGALRVEWGAGDVLTLVIDRPAQRNAVDPELLTELANSLRDAGQGARAVILRGAGTVAFSAGYDLARLGGTESDLEADRCLNEAARALRACPAPVIARLQGHCHGAGVELAMNCDLRIASDDLSLSVPAVGIGIVYRYQFVARLAQICGVARTADLLLGMPVLDAGKAYEWNLITEIVPARELDGRVDAVARKLAAAPQAAVRGTKASLNLIEGRGAVSEDAERAHQFRVAAAASPEREEALRRRKESVARRKER